MCDTLLHSHTPTELLWEINAANIALQFRAVIRGWPMTPGVCWTERRNLSFRDSDLSFPCEELIILSKQAVIQSYCKQMGTCRQIFTCPEILPHSLTMKGVKLNEYLAILAILTNYQWVDVSDITSYCHSARYNIFFTPQNRAEFTLYCSEENLGNSFFISGNLYIPAFSSQADNGHVCV